MLEANVSRVPEEDPDARRLQAIFFSPASPQGGGQAVSSLDRRYRNDED